MNKLKVVLAAIIMPFLYSIGCENAAADDGLLHWYDGHISEDFFSGVRFQDAMHPVVEGNNPAVLFMGASTSMLAGVLLPVILLDVPVRSSFGAKSFAFNKARSDYPDNHFLIAEGKPVHRNGKWYIIDPLLYKETDPLTGRESVITYWKDGYYAIEHQKGSDNAVATKLSRAQSRAITKRLCEINKVTPSKTSNIEPLEMIYE